MLPLEPVLFTSTPEPVPAVLIVTDGWALISLKMAKRPALPVPNVGTQRRQRQAFPSVVASTPSPLWPLAVIAFPLPSDNAMSAGPLPEAFEA